MADRLKRSMREVYRGIRERLPLEYRRANSRRICNRIRQLAVFRNARHIALYHAANGEVDLHDIWRSVPLQGKYCYFPVIRPDRNMHFMPATPATLFARNKHNIHEPQVESGKEINIHQLDLILLPLVAFDDYGTRLGMGEAITTNVWTPSIAPLQLASPMNYNTPALSNPMSGM